MVVASFYDRFTRRLQECGGGSVYRQTRALCLCPEMTPPLFLVRLAGGLVIRLEVTCCYVTHSAPPSRNTSPQLLNSGWVWEIARRQWWLPSLSLKHGDVRRELSGLLKSLVFMKINTVELKILRKLGHQVGLEVWDGGCVIAQSPVSV